jgi:hypothetical protein
MNRVNNATFLFTKILDSFHEAELASYSLLGGNDASQLAAGQAAK